MSIGPPAKLLGKGKVIFNTGNAIQWLQAQKKLVEKFKESGSWESIAENFGGGIDLEEPEANEVDIRFALETQRLTTRRTDALARVIDGVTHGYLLEREAYLERMNLMNKFDGELAKLESRRFQWDEDSERRHERFQKKIEQVKDKYKNCLYVFHNYLGDVAKACADIC